MHGAAGSAAAIPAQGMAPADPLQQAASAAAAAADSSSKNTVSSACAKKCFSRARELGFDRVASDSLACFTVVNGKRLGTYDCCDKV